MKVRPFGLLCLPALALHSSDACAWGLLTHVYFAQWLLWTLPFADPHLRRAIQRFPELVMVGACLPDLALVSPAFRDTHQWDRIRKLLNSARNDEETAIAIGYASHLLADVVAHNHFVPAHEAMWFDKTLFTHVTSEWAMDAHIACLTPIEPHELLTRHHTQLSSLAARAFRCTSKRADDALIRLANADRLLRMARVPHLLYGCFRTLDRRVFQHFVYYISQTQVMLDRIDLVLQGHCPAWEADPWHEGEKVQTLRNVTLGQLFSRAPTPLTLFAQPSARLHQQEG